MTAYTIINEAIKLAGGWEIKEERLIPLEVEMKLKRSNGRNEELYNENALKILKKLKEGVCSYVTLGDPMFYSTYWGIYNAIKRAMHGDDGQLKISIISGVSSLNYSLGLIIEPFIIKNSSVLITVPVSKSLTEIIKEIYFIAKKEPKPQVIVFMKAGAYLKNILSVFKDFYWDDFRNGMLNLYLIEKSVLIDNFWDRNELNFDYFSTLIAVFT